MDISITLRHSPYAAATIILDGSAVGTEAGSELDCESDLMLDSINIVIPRSEVDALVAFIRSHGSPYIDNHAYKEDADGMHRCAWDSGSGPCDLGPGLHRD